MIFCTVMPSNVILRFIGVNLMIYTKITFGNVFLLSPSYRLKYSCIDQETGRKTIDNFFVDSNSSFNLFKTFRMYQILMSC